MLRLSEKATNICIPLPKTLIFWHNYTWKCKLYSTPVTFSLILAPCLKVIIASLSSLSVHAYVFPLKRNCKEYTCWQVSMRATLVPGEQQAKWNKSCQFSPHECFKNTDRFYGKPIKPILMVTQNKTMNLKMSTTCLPQCLMINVVRLLPQQPRQKDPHPL